MIDALLDAMVSALAPLYPRTVSIARYTGRFTERDLDRFAGRSPALLISAQDFQLTTCNHIPAQPLHAGDNNLKPRKRLDGRLRTAVAVLTKDKPKQTRDSVALELIDTLLTALPYQTFGHASSMGVVPRSIRCQNLHSLTLDKKAVTLWGVVFDQDVRFERGEVPAYKKPAKVFLAKDEVTL